MPLKYMIVRCGDAQYLAGCARDVSSHAEEQVQRTFDIYDRWIERLEGEQPDGTPGFSRLHYVVVDYVKPASS
jgi:hypothetical protein